MKDTEKEIETEQQPKTEQQEYDEAVQQSKEVYRHLKKSLKRRSKNDLIHLIVVYGDQVRELQEIAKQLLEENKSLKGESNV